MRRWLAGLGVAVALCGCSSDEVASDTAERRLFVEKVQRALQPGAPALDEDALRELLVLGDDEVVARLYAQPRTTEGVFKLGLSFVGAPVDQVRDQGRWTQAAFDYEPAAAAAGAFRRGEDPLAALLTIYPRPPLGPLADQDAYAGYDYGELVPLPGDTYGARGDVVMDRMWQDFDALRDYIGTLAEPIEFHALCDDYLDSPLSFAPFLIPNYYGVPESISRFGVVPELNSADIFPIDYVCFNTDSIGDPIPGVEIPSRAELLAHIDDVEARLRAGIAKIKAVVAVWEADPESVFATRDLATYGFEQHYYLDPAFTDEVYLADGFYNQFWVRSPNSSTNFNRRRGAYVLDRFFCDDLKPVGAALPESHGENQHAADPACVACHFKLDPMAGFFRRNGVQGIVYDDTLLAATDGKIQLDDNVLLDYATYDAAWRAPEGSGRTYEVGFIRSTRDPALNSYGSTLDDLDAIIRTAPEVERCAAQRMFEHFTGRDQAVDPGFLDEIAAEMAADPAHRLERGVVRVLTSATFRAPERNTTQCYDLAGGADSEDRPPCEVASILRASCTGCHGSANPMGGLDLAHWTGGGFRHVASGVAVPRADTFARMLERVTTSDLTRQMPQNQDMPLRAREQLALWLQDQLARGD